MKIVGIIGSRRKNGNSAVLVRTVLEAVQTAVPHAETEMLFLGDYAIDACTGCEGCRKTWECTIRDDYADVVEKIDAADGIVLASPTYWYSVTSDMKRFIDRSYSLIQYPTSRHDWIGKYAKSGKLSVTAAVCEQSEESMMGNTLTLLNDFSRDIGIEVAASVKALGFFEAGRVGTDAAVLQQALEAGAVLAERIAGA